MAEGVIQKIIVHKYVFLMFMCKINVEVTEVNSSKRAIHEIYKLKKSMLEHKVINKTNT